MGFCGVRIQTQHCRKFASGLVASSRLLQSSTVVEVCAHTGREISNDRAETLKSTMRGVQLCEPQHGKRYDKDRYPFYAMQCPTGQRTTVWNVSGATTDA